MLPPLVLKEICPIQRVRSRWTARQAPLSTTWQGEFAP